MQLTEDENIQKKLNVVAIAIETLFFLMNMNGLVFHVAST